MFWRQPEVLIVGDTFSTTGVELQKLLKERYTVRSCVKKERKKFNSEVVWRKMYDEFKKREGEKCALKTQVKWGRKGLYRFL